MNDQIPEDLQEGVYQALLDASVSEKHSSLVARVCTEEIKQNSEILNWCMAEDLREVDFGKVVVAVYLENGITSRSELNSPQSSELRTAAYGIYDRWR